MLLALHMYIGWGHTMKMTMQNLYEVTLSINGVVEVNIATKVILSQRAISLSQSMVICQQLHRNQLHHNTFRYTATRTLQRC